jgi:hypothetical protein
VQLRAGAGLHAVAMLRKLRRTLRWIRALFLSDHEACLWWCFILMGCLGYVVSCALKLWRN